MICVNQALVFISKVHICPFCSISHRWQRACRRWHWWGGRWHGWRPGCRPSSGEAWAALVGVWGSGLSGEATEDLIDFSIPCPEDTHPNVGSCPGQCSFPQILTKGWEQLQMFEKGWIANWWRDRARHLPAWFSAHTWHLKSAVMVCHWDPRRKFGTKTAVFQKQSRSFPGFSVGTKRMQFPKQWKMF